jgi:hypothetical protein
MTIAIDPGKSGGIAYEDTDGSIHAVPMPDTVADLDRLLRALVCPETVCFIVSCADPAHMIKSSCEDHDHRKRTNFDSICAASRIAPHGGANCPLGKGIRYGMPASDPNQTAHQRKSHSGHWLCSTEGIAGTNDCRLDDLFA